ncbi:MAG: hypothetical protein ACOYMG_21175 [Candidatus Methylumidiphilus sp.]
MIHWRISNALAIVWTSSANADQNNTTAESSGMMVKSYIALDDLSGGVVVTNFAMVVTLNAAFVTTSAIVDTGFTVVDSTIALDDSNIA